MRSIGVITGARSDYGIYLPILRRIEEDPELNLHLIVCGMHLSPDFGSTVTEIEHDGFNIGERIEMLLSSDTPEAIAKSMGVGMIGFAQAYSRFRPDLLLVLGDRFEMLAAVASSLPFNIPIAHIHGGESTEGSIDESIRHSITKMSHLHFPSTEIYASRIRQMGEDSWRITVSGAPSLDNLQGFISLSKDEIKSRFNLDLTEPTLLVTFHPATLEFENTQAYIEELLSALEKSGMDIVLTYPNADTYGRLIIQKIQEFVKQYPKAKIAVNLGTTGYFSLMSHTTAMVGNSSSGIIEAASFKLPVVNIGTRQRGRVHGKNVIDVDCERGIIVDAISKATSINFRETLSDLVNPYGEDGHAAERIVTRLKNVALDSRLLMKKLPDTVSE